jgi:hypothetical protein
MKIAVIKLTSQIYITGSIFFYIVLPISFVRNIVIEEYSIREEFPRISIDLRVHRFYKENLKFGLIL